VSVKANIDDALTSSTDQQLKVVARVSQAERPELSRTDRGERVQTLKSHAEQSQLPVLRFVETHEGVSVSSRFWIANAVVLEVDTDQVSLDDLAGIDGVERLHANFELEAHRAETAAE